MKLSSYILLILMIGLVFALVGNIIHNFETQYPDVSINTSWENKYNYQEELAQNQTTLMRMIEKMNDEETGWFFRTLIGVAAVPVAIFTAIAIMLNSLKYGTIIITNLGKDIGIPSFVIPFAITALTIIILWGILSWWHSKTKA